MKLKFSDLVKKTEDTCQVSVRIIIQGKLNWN